MTYMMLHEATPYPALLSRWGNSGFSDGGSWDSVFGSGSETEELFMAWHYARYVKGVAAAGKSIHPLPMYVNAALVRPGLAPGRYPSAGPLPHLIDVWRAGAPSIDFLAPDIYFPNFVEWATAYQVVGNAVFIPEAGRPDSRTSVADAFFAFGELGAIGYNPFSIEDVPSDGLLAQAYDVLGRLAPIILEHQGMGTMAGVRPPVAFDGTVDESPMNVTLGDFVFEIPFVDPWTPREDQHMDEHGGLILSLEDDTFLVAGTGLTVTFRTRDGLGGVAGIERVDEGTFINGSWRTGRRLNGDQTHQGRHVRLPPGRVGIQRLTLYRYE